MYSPIFPVKNKGNGKEGGVFYYITPMGFYANSDTSQAAIMSSLSG